jgi:serine/threonine protein kinase
MYSAPEVITFDRRGRSADVYSLGCVFAEMFTVLSSRRIEDFHEFRSEPVPDEPDRMAFINSATAHKLEAWFAMQDDPLPFSLTSLMMTEDPTARPTAEDLPKELTQLSIGEICNCHSVIAAYDEEAYEPSAFEDDLNHINEIPLSVATTVGQDPIPKSARSVLSSPVFPSEAGFAFQASVTLYKTLQSFQSGSKQLRDLVEELEALSGSLGLLPKIVNASTDVDLSTLDPVLRRCGNACKDFEQEILKYSTRSGGSRTYPREWTKFCNLVDNINNFRLRLDGYKCTIRIAIATANL